MAYLVSQRAWHVSVTGRLIEERKQRPAFVVPKPTSPQLLGLGRLLASKASYSTESGAKPPSTRPYSGLTVGVPRETFFGERRVALTPQNVKVLLKKGFARVLVERGAGAEADFPDASYDAAGATLVDAGAVWAQSDMVLKVRGPSTAEADMAREGQTVVGFLHPAQNGDLVKRLAERKVTACKRLPSLQHEVMLMSLPFSGHGHDPSHISSSGV